MTRNNQAIAKPAAPAMFLFLLAALALPAACAGDAQTIDLIVRGDHVLTMDPEQSVIADGAVAVDDGMIVAIGPAAEIMASYQANEVLAGAGKVVMPGLINGHSHAAMTLLRGIADDLELMEWLTHYIFPAENRFVDAAFVRLGTELACWEMLRGGTTTFVDMYYFPDSVAEAVESCGMRAVIVPSTIDQQSPDAEDGEQSLRQAVDFVKRWRGRNNRIIPIIGVHSVYTVSPDGLVKVRAEAKKLGVAVGIHLEESPFEIEITRKNHAMTPVELLDSLGFFDGPTIGAHVVWPSETDIAVLVEKHIGVIHNPTSNMKTSAGVSPVVEMLAAGVKIGLGTDGAASNNDLDMWEEMRLAAFLQKVSTMDPEALPASAVLQMATSGGAEAIGLGAEIGSLTVGRRADLIQVDFSDVHFVPTYDVVSHLVYVADEQDVETVIVDGKIVVKNKQVLTVDTRRVRAEANALAARIQAALAADDE